MCLTSGSGTEGRCCSWPAHLNSNKRHFILRVGGEGVPPIECLWAVGERPRRRSRLRPARHFSHSSHVPSVARDVSRTRRCIFAGLSCVIETHERVAGSGVEGAC